jgi:hypothetical protein
MIDQNLPGLFDTEQWFIGNESQYPRIAVQPEKTPQRLLRYTPAGIIGRSRELSSSPENVFAFCHYEPHNNVNQFLAS